MSSNVHERLLADRLGRIAGKGQDLPRSTRVRTVTIALGICAAAISGCAAPAQPDSAAPPAVPSPEVATPLPPPALSPTAYQEALQSASSAMAPAFERLAAAGSSEDARTALDQASSATSEAARLLDVVPPAEAQAMHGDLRAGLQQLAADLSQLSGQVESMELCAPPSILASVSNATGVNDLRAVRETLGSGQLGTSYQWGEFLPAPQPLPDRRLDNGRLVDNQRRNGRGQLKVDNDAEEDAVVKLVQGDRPIVSVYVGKGASTTVGQISDGTYELFYTSGTDWDDQLKAFTRSCQFTRFEQTAEFATKSVQGGIQYTVQTIGLKPRIGGNARTESVPPQSFPR